MKIQKTRLEGIFEDKDSRQRRIYTKSLLPGKKVYDEFLVTDNDVEYREWNPNKSKLAAGILKGISQIGIKKGKTVLYLGCASGTTVSHVSDIVDDGFVFGLDFAPRVMRDFVFLCKDRKNIAPLLADANKPDSYKDRITKEVDVVFQDIAQRNQVQIFVKNCKQFLTKKGFGLLALKARSIDVTKKPKEIFKQVRKELDKELMIVDYKELYPFEKDHAMFVCKLR